RPGATRGPSPAEARPARRSSSNAHRRVPWVLGKRREYTIRRTPPRLPTSRRTAMRCVLSVAALCALATAVTAAEPAATAPTSRCFELRTYTAAPGKLEALHTRFREHTNALFAKHGMTMLGYWVPRDKDKGAESTLVYMLAFPDCAVREKAWEGFRTDPEWMKVKDASEAAGKLVDKVDSVILTATDYSPVK